MSAPHLASFAPDAIKEVSSGGNLWDNADATITGFRFTTEMPANYKITPKDGETIAPIGAVVVFELDGGAPVEERTVDQFFSLGAKVGLSYDIRKDGYGLVPKSDEAQLYSSNFTRFVKSLVENNANVLPLVAAGDFSKILGLKGHFKRIEDKNGRERTWRDKKGVEHKELTKVLLCTKVISLPAAGGTSSVASTPATGADFDLDQTATDYLVAALTAKKKPVQRSLITLMVSTQISQHAKAGTPEAENRGAIAARAGSEELLAQLSELGVVKYDAAAKGQPVSLPAAS